MNQTERVFEEFHVIKHQKAQEPTAITKKKKMTPTIDIERIKTHGTAISPRIGSNKIKPRLTTTKYILRPTYHSLRWQVEQITEVMMLKLLLQWSPCEDQFLT